MEIQTHQLFKCRISQNCVRNSALIGDTKLWYSKSGHSKKTKSLVFNTDYCLIAGKKYCRMLQREHSAILSTFIKVSLTINILVLCIFEWPLKTDFTVACNLPVDDLQGANSVEGNKRMGLFLNTIFQSQ